MNITIPKTFKALPASKKVCKCFKSLTTESDGEKEAALYTRTGGLVPDPVTRAPAVLIYQKPSHGFRNKENPKELSGLNRQVNRSARITNLIMDVYKNRLAIKKNSQHPVTTVSWQIHPGVFV